MPSTSKSKLKRDAKKTERIAAKKADKAATIDRASHRDGAADGSGSDEDSETEQAKEAATNGVVTSASTDANGSSSSTATKASGDSVVAASSSKPKQPTAAASKPDAGSLKLAKNLALELEEMDINAKYRNVTGVLDSHVRSRDLKVSSFSITFHGAEILADTKLELNCGRRYGLVGLNGAGKSTLLAVLGRREIPVPKHIDIYHLHREMPPSDKTALQAVLEVDQERVRLEKQAEELAHYDDEESHETLMDVYARLDEMSADTAETRAASILCGLGFTAKMMADKVKNFSGGWRMRIALARLLYLRPALMLLDEPTNHLDLDACVWLEEELKTYNRILVVISHSQDFLNTVCTNIIHLTRKQLVYYGGNYDAYVRTQGELFENQAKRHDWEQTQISHMKEYIARFGHGSKKLARQAQSKEKTLAKMVAGGLTEKVTKEKSFAFHFPDPGEIPPPVVMVQSMGFRYAPDKPLIYNNVDLGIDLDTRIALVGPNGAGKSTLLKLITGEINPTEGMIRRHPHLRIGRFHQHLHEILDLDVSAVSWMMKQYPDIKDPEEMRKVVGRFGLTGRQQVCPMRQLSDGQRSRVIFSWLANQAPHILALDEPTNHLDMETIDSLAEALNDFDGGMLLVSHDFRLIDQVADEIWVCEKQGVTKYEGDIKAYKEVLRKRVTKIRKQELKKQEKK